MHMKTLTTLSAAALAAVAGAAEFVVTNFTGSLNDAATYENASVPGTDDVIAWTSAASNTLSSPLAVKGISIDLPNRADHVFIDGETLSLGEDGIAITKGINKIPAPVTITTNQTWNVTSSHILYALNTVTGPDYTLYTSGVGEILFHGAMNVAGFCPSNNYAYLREGFSLNPSAQFYTCPLRVVCEDMSSDFALSDVLPSALTNLNGILEFGRHASYNPQVFGVTVTMQEGDKLADSVESVTDRGVARLDFGGHVLENRGGEIDMRWCYAFVGAYKQYSGTANFFYDFVAGIGAAYTAPIKSKPFELYMGGGTLTARRIEVGCATDWSRPTRAVFSGGTTELNGGTGYAGFALALANGPAIGTRNGYVNPDGRIEVTGDAVVNARGIWFGTYADNGAANNYSVVTNGYGEILLTGGELYIGDSGLKTAPTRWMPTSDGTNTWTAVRMSGGSLGSAPSTANSVIGIYVPITLEGTNNTFLCENPSGAGNSINVYAPLFGEGGFTKTGPGAMRIYGEHLATGKVTIAYGTLLYGNPASSTEVVRVETEVPAANFTWTADSLDGDAGTGITSWAPTNATSSGSNTFTTDALRSLGITAPKISANTMNGHRTLAFNAADCSGIGMGGANAKNLLGSPTSMTWAFVFRTPTNAPVFHNGDDVYQNYISALFSRTFTSQQIAVLLRTDGSIGLGMKNTDAINTPFETVWAPQRDTRFNDTHVLFITWDDSTDSYSITMDGYTQSSTLQTSLDTFANSAITIGLIDHRMRDSKAIRPNNHFTGEIAEIRYYKNTAFTKDQLAQVGRELAECYGAPLYGYLTDAEKANAVAPNAREYELQKSSSTVVGALKGENEMYLGEGQRIWGSGYVNSGLTLREGAILDMAHDGEGLSFRNPTDYPPTTHGLTLDGGAVVRVAYHDDGVTSEPTTVSQLTLRGTNVIQVACTDEKPAPNIVLFQAAESITIEDGAAWKIEGAGTATQVVVDETAKTVSLSTSLGTVIIVR